MTATVRGISIEDRGGSFNRELDKEFTLVYKVETDDKNDGPNDVMLAVGIPKIGDLYIAGNDFDPDAVVVDKRASQTGSPTEWEVEVTFSTELDDDPSTQEENPLNEPADISYSFQERRVLVPGRYNNPDTPPANKAFDVGILAPNGEPFVPAPEADIAEPVLVITRNYSSLPNILAIQNTVNLTPFFGADARQLRMRADARRRWNKTIGFYWPVTFRMVFRFETWDIQKQNQGTFHWTNGLPTDPASTSRADEREPFLVAGRPALCNLTTDGKLNTTNTPTYTRLRVYREIDFNALGIL